jgi:hypothetical protein
METVGELCTRLMWVKAQEAQARADRIKVEEQIAAIVGHKDEGTVTTVTDGYKISVTTKLNRKLDIEAYENLEVPDFARFVTYKPEIDLKRLRAVEMIDPALVARCVTTSPAKKTIKVEEVTQ